MPDVKVTRINGASVILMRRKNKSGRTGSAVFAKVVTAEPGEDRRTAPVQTPATMAIATAALSLVEFFIRRRPSSDYGAAYFFTRVSK
jgi:hypothetical protein